MALAACAQPARVDNMQASSFLTPSQMQATPLHKNVVVKPVTGGQETNAMWVSKVSSADFQAALERSLQSAGLSAAPASNAPYALTVNLEELDQPIAGISMTVKAVVQYELKNTADGKLVYQRRIESPYTAAFSDSYMAVERLRLANEGAARENIRMLIEDLYKVKP
jgi:hypothetical protein